jgi:serine/threonine protein kinase
MERQSFGTCIRAIAGAGIVSDAASIIDGYELINCIATGNVSQVWEVKQVASGQSFAMKLLLPEAFADPEEKRILKQEAKVGKAFDHPNLIRIHEVKVSRKHAYFIMELFRGVNLKSMIRGDLPALQVRAKKVMELVAQALSHMHEKGWVHKDIKPENILMTKGSEVRVIDFSLATRAASAISKVMTRKKNVIIQGTRTYIAPELIRREPTTPAADVYSFGITLYEVLTGRPPFVMGNPNELLMAHVRVQPEKPSEYNNNISPEADQLVMKLLAKRVKERHQNMQEVFAELRSIQLFKTDPSEDAERKASAAADNFKDSMAARLDSRIDAERSPEERAAAEAAALQRARMLEQKKKLAMQSAADEQKSTKRSAPPPQQPAPAAPMMPGAFPMPPGYAVPPMGYMPMPGYPPPMPWPGAPPGMPMPPGAAPPPGMAPPAGVPQAPQQTPPASVPPPAAPSPPPASPVRKKTVDVPLEEAEDLPLMDELPDVM